MSIKSLLTILTVCASLGAMAQDNVQHLSTLNLGNKAKKVFSSKDSSLTVEIDTLIMGDKSSLQFPGKKDVTLIVKHAVIGKNAVIFGSDGKNNAANFDISLNLQKLGSLYVLAAGQDAFNGTRTYPNGNGGQVTLRLDKGSITPQESDKKAPNYLHVDVKAGGLNVNAQSDLRNIYSQIKMSQAGLRGVPRGQIYSGSPGTAGSFKLIQ